MLGAAQIANQGLTPYATGADFCRIFEEDMSPLYLLSFLLTGDQTMAERCFVRGLEDSAKGNAVFKEWAQSWARRTIIQSAIQMIGPQPTDSSRSTATSDGSPGRVLIGRAEIAAVVELPSFERFVFVLSVLERYSDQDCSLLLKCTRGDVFAARGRAVQKIGRSAELQPKLVNIGSGGPALRDDSQAELRLERISHLAALA
jgi:DNA-directed RNA polymerase specialized sigma24 family protein